MVFKGENYMTDIKNYNTFVKIEPINKGWSSDKKYYIETKNGEKLLLRVADISEYERKKNEFEVIKRISKLGINMSQPIDFGVCDNGQNVYQLLTWCDGEEATIILPTLSEAEQYTMGFKAGKILKKIHTIESYQNLIRNLPNGRNLTVKKYWDISKIIKTAA